MKLMGFTYKNLKNEVQISSNGAADVSLRAILSKPDPKWALFFFFYWIFLKNERPLDKIQEILPRGPKSDTHWAQKWTTPRQNSGNFV